MHNSSVGMNAVPSAERVHIGIFGRRNAGKSRLVNALTGQNLSIVSEIRGTTTDPVQKAMELLPLGPVVMIDTPGIDDEGDLGELRVRKSYQVLNKTDIALLVVDSTEGMQKEDYALLAKIREKNIPYLIVLNKTDVLASPVEEGEDKIGVSAVTGDHIHELKERIAHLVPKEGNNVRIIGDHLSPGDLAVLVIPIDSAAPKGRLILPQQQTIRDILEADASAVVVREYELKSTLAKLAVPPRVVITDSQAFRKVAEDTPDDILLTSFSILFARYKGQLKPLLKGVRALDTLKDGDKILIAEGCTHHRQCDDIGTVKIPRWIREYTGADIEFETSSGTEFPTDLSAYKMVVHCGGCMLNEREMKYRIACAEDQNVPIANYGMVIARVQGILERSLRIFPELAEILHS